MEKKQIERILGKLTKEQMEKNEAVLQRIYYLLCVIYRQA